MNAVREREKTIAFCVKKINVRTFEIVSSSTFVTLFYHIEKIMQIEIDSNYAQKYSDNFLLKDFSSAIDNFNYDLRGKNQDIKAGFELLPASWIFSLSEIVELSVAIANPMLQGVLLLDEKSNFTETYHHDLFVDIDIFSTLVATSKANGWDKETFVSVIQELNRSASTMVPCLLTDMTNAYNNDKNLAHNVDNVFTKNPESLRNSLFVKEKVVQRLFVEDVFIEKYDANIPFGIFVDINFTDNLPGKVFRVSNSSYLEVFYDSIREKL